MSVLNSAKGFLPCLPQVGLVVAVYRLDKGKSLMFNMMLYDFYCNHKSLYQMWKLSNCKIDPDVGPCLV